MHSVTCLNRLASLLPLPSLKERAGHMDIDLFAVLTSIASACKQISALVSV